MTNNPILYYVDDDSDDLMIFDEAAKEVGVETQLFNSGEKLLLALEDPNSEPSIVFVDLNMPGKSGYEVLAEMRASERWKDLPAVVLSTASDTYSIDKSRAAGASLYMQKPTSIGKLIGAVRDTLTRDWSNQSETEFLYVWTRR